MSIETPLPDQQLISGRSIRPGKSGAKTVKVNILGKEIQIGCAASEEQALQRAARYVDTSMQESRDRNKTLPVEKIAIVTAINIANELLRAHGTTEPDTALQEKLENLNRKLDELIEPVKQGRKSSADTTNFEVNTDS